MLTISKVRQHIIEQAMRGKLVPQNPDDESASAMLEKMKLEEDELIKEGKMKKKKSLPPINESEIPYKLPSGWIWVRLGDVTNYGESVTVNNDDVLPETWVLELEDIEKDTSKIVKKVLHVDRPFRSTKNVFHKGDVLYGKLRPYLNKVVVAEENGICSTEILPIRSRVYNPKFLMYAFKRIDFQNYINAKMYGSKMPRLGTSQGRMALFPLPPYNEQTKIVEKIEELFSISDQWESEVKYQQENIQLLRKKILSDALSGILVEQNKNDEPVSVFLKKEEIKKVSKNEEGLYELPQSWEWIRLGEISNKIHYGYTASAINKDTGVKMVRITDIQNEQVNWDTVPFCEIDEASIKKYSLQRNDILIARTGGTVGKSFIVDNITDVSVFASYLIRVQLIEGINAQYVKRFLESNLYWEQIQGKVKGTGQPNVNATGLKNLLIPLPPVQEQNRIVEKINKIFSIVDELENNMVLPK